MINMRKVCRRKVDKSLTVNHDLSQASSGLIWSQRGATKRRSAARSITHRFHRLGTITNERLRQIAAGSSEKDWPTDSTRQKEEERVSLCTSAESRGISADGWSIRERSRFDNPNRDESISDPAQRSKGKGMERWRKYSARDAITKARGAARRVSRITCDNLR